jgi:hypothetical protein
MRTLWNECVEPAAETLVALRTHGHGRQLIASSAARGATADSCGADSCGADSCGADSCGADACGADACGAGGRGAVVPLRASNSPVSAA